MIYFFIFIFVCAVYLSMVNTKIKNTLIYILDVRLKTKIFTEHIVEKCLDKPIKKTDIKNATKNSIIWVEVFIFFFGWIICVYLIYKGVSGFIRRTKNK